MRSFSLRSWIWCTGAAASLLAVPFTARAASIDLDTYQFLPDAPTQQVQVYVGGTEANTGVTLSVFTGDDSADAGRGLNAPKIRSNVDLFAESSVFSINSAGYVESAPISAKNLNNIEAQFLAPAAGNPSGPLTLDTPIAPLPAALTTLDTIDTAGFPTARYSRVLDNPAASPTRFRAIVGGGGAIPGTTIGEFDPSSAPGSISAGAVPEPASIGLFAILVPAMLIRRRHARI